MSQQLQPEVKFDANVPLLLEFPFGDFRELHGSNDQGSWVSYKYNVNREVAGQKARHTLFAKPALQALLQAPQVGMGAGMAYQVTHRQSGQNWWWEVASADGQLLATSGPAAVPVGPALAPTRMGTPIASTPIPPTPPPSPSERPQGRTQGEYKEAVDRRVKLLNYLLREVKGTLEAMGYQPLAQDLHAPAASLFISLDRAGWFSVSLLSGSSTAQRQLLPSRNPPPPPPPPAAESWPEPEPPPESDPNDDLPF